VVGVFGVGLPLRRRGAAVSMRAARPRKLTLPDQMVEQVGGFGSALVAAFVRAVFLRLHGRCGRRRRIMDG